MNPVDVDIDDVLTDVISVLRERETGRSQSYRSEVREIEDVIYLMPGAWQSIANSLTALDQSLAPLEASFTAAEEPEEEGGGFAQRFKNIVKRVIQKSVYWYVNPIVAQLHRMHASTARAMHEMADQLKNISDRLEALEKDTLGPRVRALEGERFDERIGRLERAWRQRAAEAAEPPARMQPAATVVPFPQEERGVGRDRVPAGRAEPLFNFDYYWFESIHRGDRALIKRRQQPYLEYFEGCANVLDVGCGRGEFLELLRERGIRARGIDVNAEMVERCRQAGLDVQEADALAYLTSLEDGSLGGLLAAQVVEHLRPGYLMRWLEAAYHKLRPGSHIVLETVNPACWAAFFNAYLRDITHTQPLHPDTLKYLLTASGFASVEIHFNSPYPEPGKLQAVSSRPGTPPELQDLIGAFNANVERVNGLLFTFTDYAAIGDRL